MIIAETSNHDASDSGAIKPADNLATTAGYVALASGGALAMGVGVAVAPAPTLGLMTIGGATIVAANFEEVKNHFTGGTPATEEAPATA